MMQFNDLLMNKSIPMINTYADLYLPSAYEIRRRESFIRNCTTSQVEYPVTEQTEDVRSLSTQISGFCAL